MVSIRRHNTSWKHSLLFDDRAQRSAMCWCSSELNTTQNGPGECDKMKDLRRIVMIDLYHFELQGKRTFAGEKPQTGNRNTFRSTMTLVFRIIPLALVKDSSSSPLIAIRFCLFFKKLNKSKGAGLDGMSSRLILNCADLIAPHISITFISNSSLANGFPADWSLRGLLLCQHGERSDIDNNRPISVISITGKVFERIIYNQLFAYLSDHNSTNLGSACFIQQLHPYRVLKCDVIKMKFLKL